MKKIPADLDALMWTIAEGGDVSAADDFEQRFPQFRGELASRLAMVRGLKRSKPVAETSREIPKFVPRASEELRPARRPVWTVALIGGLAAAAFGSYLVVTNLNRPSPPKPTAPVNQTVRDPGQITPPVSSQPAGQGEPEALQPNVTGNNGAAIPTPPVVEMPWDKRRSLSIQEAPLEAVLKLIAETCEMRIELAPGMQNPTISAAFQERTGMEMLKELGRLHQFTALDQGKGNVLIVPAVDFSSPQ